MAGIIKTDAGGSIQADNIESTSGGAPSFPNGLSTNEISGTPDFPTGFTNNGTAPEIKYQQKILNANVVANGAFTAVDANFKFDGLTIGKHYRISFQCAIVNNSGDNSTQAQILHNGTSVARVSAGDTGTGSNDGAASVVTIFTATATSLTFNALSINSGSYIVGDGTANITNAILEELPYHTVTTDFT